MARWSWLLTRIVRQIWFRAALISLLSIGLAIGIALVAPALPYEFRRDIGQDSVGTILSIIATSMLAVTTFSLNAMVSAYGSATQLATPRATQLMISDPTSQNALSTFLGAFVFSIVGIIGLQSSAYGPQGRAVLFASTVFVVVLVVVTLLRWIAHIAAFGRMADVIDRVEDAAAQAMADFAADPHFGGRPAVPIPEDAQAVTTDATGYVTHIDVPALSRIAERAGLVVHVTALPGTMVHPARPLLRVAGAADAATRAALSDAFSIERHRSFDQDPRLGVIALAEIASRALSPATNDPGTAIEVLNALLRVFLKLRERSDTSGRVADGPAVHIGAPSLDEMLVDAFRPIARDGGDCVEVMVRLDSTLAALNAALPAAREPLATAMPLLAERVRSSLADAGERAAFERSHAALWSSAA